MFLGHFRIGNDTFSVESPNLFYSYPARSAKNCDVYVGGKVRVAKL